jgi:hypothetical protein
MSDLAYLNEKIAVLEARLFRRITPPDAESDEDKAAREIVVADLSARLRNFKRQRAAILSPTTEGEAKHGN